CVASECAIDLRLKRFDVADAAFKTERSNQLSNEATQFCEDIFAQGGAIIAGAAGGRFVYDMRRRFQLYYKLNPLRSYPELAGVSRLRAIKQIDILIARENLGGLYQGNSKIVGDEREVWHTFVQSEDQVRAVLKIGAKAARARRNCLAVIGKQSGLPEIYSLWRRCALEIGASSGVKVTLTDIDYASYQLVQQPDFFDVIVAPNCFGDILSDLGGLFAGSRGLTFGPSYPVDGSAVYQTTHGAAHDLAGTEPVNPGGQILSAARTLRQT